MMRNKYAALFLALAMTGTLLAGCGSAQGGQGAAQSTEAAEAPAAGTEEAQEADAAEIPAAPYFTEGVYANYSSELEDPSKTYFYVFNGEDVGYTADGDNDGIGVPFTAEQSDGDVAFLFGSADEAEEHLIITEVTDGLIYGYFEDVPERPLVFELLADVEAEGFSAENYVNGPERSVYRDANGWHVQYDATKFEITQEGPQVSFVYTGEASGANTLTATYTVENGAEAAIKELGASWGDGTEYSEEPFPGANYAVGYRATFSSEEDGAGLFETAVARNFMGGALIFEITEHKGEDGNVDAEASDLLSGLMDSLAFDVYDYDTIIDALADGVYYAFADMDDINDALLVTAAENVYDDGDGNMLSSEATVYGYDGKGQIKEYGEVLGGGTATPLACKDHILFYGGRDYMNKVHIDEVASEMVTDEGAYFDEYEDAIEVHFTKK